VACESAIVALRPAASGFPNRARCGTDVISRPFGASGADIVAAPGLPPPVSVTPDRGFAFLCTSSFLVSCSIFALPIEISNIEQGTPNVEVAVRRVVNG
jgi:hypothetical protein